MSAAGTHQHRPARGYTWPPFEDGNTAALTHGAWSPRTVQPIADEVFAHFVAVAPWVTSPAFEGTVRSLAWAEAQARLLRADIDAHGIYDDEGEERAAVRTLDRIEGRLAKLRDQLGLTPAALGKLLATAATVAAATGDAASVEALQAEGRALLDARGVLAASAPAAPLPATVDAEEVNHADDH